MSGPRRPKIPKALCFEEAPVALAAVDPDSLNVIAANRLARAMLGWDREREASGFDFSAIFSAADNARLAGLLREQIPLSQPHSFVVKNPGGGEREIDLTARRVEGDNSVIVAMQDQQGRGRRPEQVRQSQRMEAMGMLAGGVAHDFNNLLTIIAGYSQMLRSSGQMRTERDRSALDQVLKACERAAELTAQLLSFSRRQSSQPRVVDIPTIVSQTAGMLRRLIGEDVELHIHNTTEPARTYADSGQIQQILLNLAINARDAMPDGGSLDIETRVMHIGPEYIGQNFRIKQGHYIRLDICDTGSGMDEITRKRVFEPFFTTKPQGKGTGLGLATVYGIVNQCGGSIDIFSEPGKGTRIYVYFPLVNDEVAPDAHAPRKVRGGSETVLLVEDEEGVRRLVRSALERSGYHVLFAASGTEAMDIAKSHSGPIDLLITDMVMPKMSGRELARRLLEGRPGLPILFISGYPDAILEAGPGQAAPAFLQKPFAPSDLTLRVRSMLDARKTSASNGAGRVA